MKNRLRSLGAFVCFALLCSVLSGCEDGRLRSPKVNVRVVNAAPTTPAITFIREHEANPASGGLTLDYRGASSNLPYDADQYDFNVYAPAPGTGAMANVATFSQELLADNNYLFVLTEVGGLVQALVLANPVYTSTSQTQVAAVHAAPSLGAMDVYFTAPGADLTTATPLGNAAFTTTLAPTEMAPGDYTMRLTAPGDPANVLFTSVTLSLTAGQSNAFIIADDAGDGLAPFSVVASGSSSGLLVDQSVTSGVEVVNAVADGAARDVFADADYTAPLIANLPYATLSAMAPIAAGTRNLSITPQANPGVVEDEQQVEAVQGRRFTVLFAGEPGSLSAAVAQDDARLVANQARIRFLNASTQLTPLQFFLAPPGTDVTGVNDSGALATPGITPRTSVPPGDYDLVIIDPDTDTVVGGPQLITLGVGVYGILAVNGAAAGTVDVVLLEGFN